MAIRRDDKIERELAVEHLGTRDSIRNFLLAEWMKERVHEQYRYFAETLSGGKRLYLERPGRLNKGCDFVIFIEDLFEYKNGNDKPPSHKDLFADLEKKKQLLRPKSREHLMAAIKAVHSMERCTIPQTTREEIDRLAPMSVEQILLLCKWFFIEQDLTYWSGKGRDMLWEALEKWNRHS